MTQVTHELTVPIYQAGIARCERELRDLSKVQNKTQRDRERQLLNEKYLVIYKQKVAKLKSE